MVACFMAFRAWLLLSPSEYLISRVLDPLLAMDCVLGSMERPFDTLVATLELSILRILEMCFLNSYFYMT
ncbi:hypothetical protein XELAEV_18034076mg [Xenopus laevis]|uniref:Uncharacterized protein n=1 Tax=Xenopus laevis TaxID=8355 RepID=A0A974CMQ8_XENLA|nr:hypothetical protein XELAEV_18034076mg [Xenopus laevis]